MKVDLDRVWRGYAGRLLAGLYTCGFGRMGEIRERFGWLMETKGILGLADYGNGDEEEEVGKVMEDDGFWWAGRFWLCGFWMG